MATNYLFSPSLTPSTPLPTNFKFRPLSRDDYDAGHLDVLRDLAEVGPITKEQWTERYDWMKGSQGSYYVLVIEHEGKVVGTGTLIAEKKFLFRLGVQGHIEDISIKKEFQGKGLGKALLAALGEVAKGAGCYKSILDCNAQKSEFYVKCGFEKKGMEMEMYFDEEARKFSV
ncbi:putative Glucosamine 6-phosphate N-acetyltransferase 1 [Glarea lozoyensis 74030]|uniref:Glucosamine 6-phosphate N-acetyltransferase n=1 Tax=Glarea lozoyensis (strain ATCC 74030 / MF5533) TaxID=1104152 RepID=H0EZ36_GLAL7|nr:putative Glucosamine 6-phosphate N-acetyltransferase 1 [Glarea lozoyensis 74030]